VLSGPTRCAVSPTKQIESLTEEQRGRFAEFADRWTAVGLCTEPADRTAAEAGVRLAYEIAAKPAPRIVWCMSPLSGALARAIVTSKKVRASVVASIRASVSDSVRASVWASVEASVAASVRASVWDSVWDSVVASVWDSVAASVRDSVAASVSASVSDSVAASVSASVWDSVAASVRAACYGQHDATGLAFHRYFHDVCGLVEQTKKLSGLWAIAESAGWFWPDERVCWVCERQSRVRKDDRGRLHADDGAAVQYPDGWGVWAWHGVRVPRRVIQQPETLKVDEIDGEQNVEVRRVMIERFGQQRYLTEGNAKLLHHDDWGTLYRREIRGDEPLVMVSVVNATREPTGEFKNYWLRVPPNMTTAREAVAWTFAKEENEYAPTVES